MAKNQSAEGASKALNKTIKEIDAFLKGAGVSPPTADLRNKLHRRLRDFAQKWYRRGFNRGHLKSYTEYKARGSVPKTLKVSVSRKLFGKVRRTVKLKSTAR